jgi:hypothetical protein
MASGSDSSWPWNVVSKAQLEDENMNTAAPDLFVTGCSYRYRDDMTLETGRCRCSELGIHRQAGRSRAARELAPRTYVCSLPIAGRFALSNIRCGQVTVASTLAVPSISLLSATMPIRRSVATFTWPIVKGNALITVLPSAVRS